jgi:hypothetical protein
MSIVPAARNRPALIVNGSLAKVPAKLRALSAVVVGDGGVASHMEMEMEVTAACRLVFRRYPCCQSLSA